MRPCAGPGKSLNVDLARCILCNMGKVEKCKKKAKNSPNHSVMVEKKVTIKSRQYVLLRKYVPSFFSFFY